MNKRREERILTPTEVEGLEKRIAERTQSQESGQLYDASKEYGISSSQQVDRTVKRMQRELDQHKPGSVNREERIKRERQLRIDEEFLTKNMVPKNHTEVRPGTPEYRKYVSSMVKEMSPEMIEIQNRVKNNARLLYPDDPEKANTERLRPS